MCKINSFCAKKNNKFAFGEEHATSHIQVGTAVTELAKYILQVDIWQAAELCGTALYWGLRERHEQRCSTAIPFSIIWQIWPCLLGVQENVGDTWVTIAYETPL